MIIPAKRVVLFISLTAFMSSGCSTGTASTTVPVATTTGVPALLDTVFVATDAWASPPAGALELFSVGGTTPTRLTYTTIGRVFSAAPSLDRARVALRRANTDTNGDGIIDEMDRVTLLLVDLARQIEGPFLPDGWSTSSVDWSSDGTFLIHTSSPDSSVDDIYQMDTNGQNNAALLITPTVRERGARLNAGISRVVYERIDGTGVGKSEIWVFLSSTVQSKLTDGGTIGAALPNSYYLVGSDASPDYSPDGANVVFRRLTSTAVAGGTWDILVVSGSGGTPRVIASGPQFRSSPDWSKDGIVFAESNPTTGGTDVVVINPDTGARKVLQSFPNGVSARAARWIAGIAG